MKKTQQSPAPEKQLSVIDRLNNAFMDLLKSRPFPVHRLSKQWLKAAKYSLLYCSPSSIGISIAEYTKLTEINPKEPVISFFQFAYLSNNLEARSPNDLNLSMDKYVKLLTEAASHVEYYSESIAKFRKECEEKIAAEDIAKDPEKAANAMKAVKAEA